MAAALAGHRVLGVRRAIRRRPVMLAATAVRLAVIGLVATAAISCTSHSTASPHASAAAGRLRWSYTVRGITGGPAVAGGTVYIASSEQMVYALDAATGRLRWSHSAAWIDNGPVVAGDTVYACGWNGQVYALDAATGRLRWSYKAGVVALIPAAAGGTVYVGSVDGKVYALSS
jgi:outer membrane protein assembly factor BamB